MQGFLSIIILFWCKALPAITARFTSSIIETDKMRDVVDEERVRDSASPRDSTPVCTSSIPECQRLSRATLTRSHGFHQRTNERMAFDHENCTHENGEIFVSLPFQSKIYALFSSPCRALTQNAGFGRFPSFALSNASSLTRVFGRSSLSCTADRPRGARQTTLGHEKSANYWWERGNFANAIPLMMIYIRLESIHDYGNFTFRRRSISSNVDKLAYYVSHKQSDDVHIIGK